MGSVSTDLTYEDNDSRSVVESEIYSQMEDFTEDTESWVATAIDNSDAESWAKFIAKEMYEDDLNFPDAFIRAKKRGFKYLRDKEMKTVRQMYYFHQKIRIAKSFEKLYPDTDAYKDVVAHYSEIIEKQRILNTKRKVRARRKAK
jgi:hypothetical protein